MALIIDLKPKERVIIGNALITNDSTRARLHIEGDAAILREKDIMREEEANSPCKRIYFTVQLMYLADDPMKLHELYFTQVKEIQEAAPSTAIHFMKINDFILADQYYKALKEARGLIDYEAKLLANVDPNNPYGAAAAAYGNTAATGDPRALEGQVLLKAATRLEELSKRLQSGEKVPLIDISAAVDYNRKLWTVFAGDMANPESPLPKEIRNNIASLAYFMFKTSVAVLVDPKPEKIKPMIDINRSIASGLMKTPKAPPASSVPLPPARPNAGQKQAGQQKPGAAPEKRDDKPTKGSTDNLV